MKPGRFEQQVLRASSDAGRERLKLAGLCALMAITGVVLAGVGGPPRIPTELPRLKDILETLSGSTLPVTPFALLLVDLAWVMWIWIVGSLGLELVVAVGETVATRARWVRSLRRLSDRLSVPLARRAVAAAFAVQVLSRGVPIAAAQPISPAETSLLAEAPAEVTASEPAVDHTTVTSSPTYLVRAGDTLWSIAERAYGSGTEYRRVIAANLGRQMSDGRVFTAQGVIQPGWQLLVPGAVAELVEDANGERWYTVRPGDSLSAIAADVLGDSSRWNELLELNYGATTADGSHTLTDPNVIWPGLRLRVSTSLRVADPSAQPDEDPPADLVDLVVASAPPPPPIADPAASTAEPPPLLRTVHVPDPIVLEPADAPSEVPDPAAVPPSEVDPAADADVSLPQTQTPAHLDVPAVPLALGGLGLAAIAGLAFGARRIRRLRPLPQEPESEVVVEGGFAEAQLAHDLSRGLHGVGFDPLGSLIEQLEQFLLEYNLSNVGVLAVRHGRSSTTITLRCGLAEQALLVDLAPVFTERLEADAEASVTADQDVSLRLTRLRRTRLLPVADSPLPRPCLLPVGVLYDRQVYSVAWNSLGHALVVSLPGHGAETILTSLVATLTARRSPEQLRIWILGTPRAMPAPIFELPHLARVVDPSDQSALVRAADDLRGELDRRAADPSDQDLVVVIPEVMLLGEHAATLALLAAHAAELGVRFVAASTQPEEVAANPLSVHCSTRLVLRMQSEEASVALLGVSDAMFLGGGGRLLLSLDRRETVELYGYQVASEHLERLVRVMRSAYASTSLPPQAPTPLERAADRPAEPTAPVTTPTPVGDDQPTEPSAPVLPTEGAPPAAPGQGPEVEPVSEIVVRPPAPIQVTCFGDPLVSCAGQQVWPRVSTGDAKPWEFLLYLASQPAEGVSRDQAVDALWPDDEAPEDAAHRFRQLRYRLRQQFGEVPDAPPSDGVYFHQGVLRLDRELVYSDAQEFLELVRSVRVNPGPDAVERLERARALYTGDLLEGPHTRRYAWVDERDASGVTLREHFRRLFQQASTRLGELYAISGALERAIEVYRELTEIDPGDERLWLALLRLDARRGDRLALIREERRLREALRDLSGEVDLPDGQILEPSREVVQEYQRLLAGLHNQEAEPLTA